MKPSKGSSKARNRAASALKGILQTTEGARFTRLHWSRITPRKQVRRQASERRIEELVDSFKATGQLQTITIMPIAPGDQDVLNPEADYVIIAGERRWHACQRLDIQVDAIIRPRLEGADDIFAMLEENTQREDLTPFELAAAIEELKTKHGHTQDNIAKRLGFGKSYVSRLLRLNNCPVELEDLYEAGHVTDINTLTELAGLHRRAPELAAELVVEARELGLTRARVREVVSSINAPQDTGNKDKTGGNEPSRKEVQGSTQTGAESDTEFVSEPPAEAGVADAETSAPQSSMPGGKAPTGPAHAPSAESPPLSPSVSVMVSWIVDEEDSSRAYGELLMEPATDPGDICIQTGSGILQIPAHDVRIERIEARGL